MPNTALAEVPSQNLKACSYDDASNEHEYEGLDQYMAAYEEINFRSKEIPIQQNQVHISKDYELAQFATNMMIKSDEKSAGFDTVGSLKSTVL